MASKIYLKELRFHMFNADIYLYLVTLEYICVETTKRLRV